MTSSINKKDEFTVDITVELNADDLQNYISEAEKHLAKDANIDGFRAGKVPTDVIRKKLGEDTIRQEALNIAIEGSLNEALKKEDLDIIEQTDFNIKENSKSKLVYTLKAIVLPRIEIGDYKNIEIKRNKVEVSEQEQNRIIQDILKSRASIRAVERPARKGDRVEVNFTLKHKGEVVKDGTSTNHPIVLGETRLMPGLEERIVGMKTNEAKQFELDIPKNYNNKDLAGKKIEVDLTLMTVQERELPELTDDFVKSLGNFPSVSDLTKNIHDGLKKEKEAKEKSRVRVELLSKVVEKSVVKVPAILVDQQLDAMIRDFDAELHSKGMELGLYLAQIKKTQEELKKDWHPQAEKQTKMQIVSRTIAREEKISVQEEEVEAELQKVLQQYHMDSDPEALKKIDLDTVRARIRSTMLSERVFELLEKSAKFIN